MAEPWIKLKIGLSRSSKMAELSSDTARLGWVYILLAAKTLRQMGVFAGRHHFDEVMGRFGRHRAEYIRVGLLEAEPDLCEDCAARYTELRPGSLVVHNYLREQRSSMPVVDAPSSGAKRTAMWRMRQAVFERDHHTCRYCGRDDYERSWLIAEHVDPEGLSTMENLVTACRSCNHRKGSRTPEEAGMTLLPVPSSDGVMRHGDTSRAARDGVSSRARPTTATVTGTRRRSSPDGRGSSNRGSAAPPERADVEALLGRGWRRVTPKQRAVLDEIADRHRRRGDDGSWFAVETIAGVGDMEDPLRAVIDADKAEQKANLERARHEDGIWAATKAQEREAAEKLMAGARQ